MNGIMKIIKKDDIRIISQNFDNLCRITISVRAGYAAEITAAIAEIEGASVIETG